MMLLDPPGPFRAWNEQHADSQRAQRKAVGLEHAWHRTVGKGAGVLCPQTPGWAQASHGGSPTGRWVSGLHREASVGGPPACQDKTSGHTTGLRHQGFATLGVGMSSRLRRLTARAALEPQFRLRAGQQFLAPLSYRGLKVDRTPRASLIPLEKRDTEVSDWTPSSSPAPVPVIL